MVLLALSLLTSVLVMMIALPELSSTSSSRRTGLVAPVGVPGPCPGVVRPGAPLPSWTGWTFVSKARGDVETDELIRDYRRRRRESDAEQRAGALFYRPRLERIRAALRPIC